MNQQPNNGDSEMLDEYDFSGGVRGKYTDRFPKASSVVVILEPDANIFKDSESVNEALRNTDEKTEDSRYLLPTSDTLRISFSGALTHAVLKTMSITSCSGVAVDDRQIGFFATVY